MTLPKQVQKQLEEVAEIEKSLTAPVVVEQTGDTPPETANPVVTAETPPIEQVAATPAAELKSTDPEETWEQRYKSLNGKFNAEVPPLYAKVRDLTNNLHTALGEIETLKTSSTKLPEVKPAPSVTPEDEEAFGKDLIELNRRIAAEAIAPLSSKMLAMETENAQLKEVLGRTGNEVANMTFEQRLSAAVPDFTAINEDPKWVAWLDDIDPYSLEPRRVQAEADYQMGNVQKVAHYVAMFKRMTTTPAVPNPKPDQRQAELQSQIAPNRSQAVVEPQSQALKVYSEAEASKLYDRVAELNRAGKYDEAAKLDAELTTAYNSGRVR